MESELPVFLSGSEILVSRDSLPLPEPVPLIEGLVEDFLSLCGCECVDWTEEERDVGLLEDAKLLVLGLCPSDGVDDGGA